jgi:hypothetical protein
VGQYDLTRAVQHLGSANAIEAWIRNPGRYRKDVKMPAWEGVIHNDEYGLLVEYVQLLGRRMASR